MHAQGKHAKSTQAQALSGAQVQLKKNQIIYILKSLISLRSV